MIRFPNAKINLGLHITEKRPDGFHDLETVFYPVNWYDVVEIVPSTATETTMKVYGADFGDFRSNLCYRAWRLMKDEFQIPDVSIFLQKVIPYGAGLGGGSSDAAFVLVMLNEMYELKLSQDKLASLASKLGSDCPFFIYNKPMMATGRGEVLSHITISLEKYHFLIVMPDVKVSTAEAYSMIQPRQPDLPLNAVLQLPVNQWKYALVNDFEEPVFRKYPVVKELKEKLYQAGAVYASMSGSGAAVFGIFEKEIQPLGDFANFTVWQGRGEVGAG